MLPYPQVIRHETVEQVHIVLAEGAQVEKFINGRLLQGQLSQTCQEISSGRDSRSGGGYTNSASSEPRRTPHAGESDRRCGDTCECREGWLYRNSTPYVDQLNQQSFIDNHGIKQTR